MRRYVFATVLVLAASLVAVVLVRSRDAAAEVIEAARWMRSAGLAGVVIFAIAYCAATLAFFPSSPLGIATGFAYGFFAGSVLAVSVGVLASLLAFGLGRTVLKPWVQRRYANRSTRSIDRAVRERGLAIVVLLRLAPFVPFAAANYILAMTGVGARTYAVGTALGITPTTVLCVYLGSVAPDVIALITGAEPRPGFVAVLVIGIALSIALGVVLVRITRDIRAAAGDHDALDAPPSPGHE